MNWTELKSQWKYQSGQAQPEIELDLLRPMIDARRRRLAQTLIWLDLAGALPGVIAFGSFAYAGWSLAAILALPAGAGIFYAMRRSRSNHQDGGTELSLLAKVDADIAELRHRRRLLFNIPIWYLGPAVGALLMPLIVPFLNAHRGTRPSLQSHLFTVGVITFGIIFMIRIVWLIHYLAVRNKLDPRLAELERQRNELLSEL